MKTIQLMNSHEAASRMEEIQKEMDECKNQGQYERLMLEFLSLEYHWKYGRANGSTTLKTNK